MPGVYNIMQIAHCTSRCASSGVDIFNDCLYIVSNYNSLSLFFLFLFIVSYTSLQTHTLSRYLFYFSDKITNDNTHYMVISLGHLCIIQCSIVNNFFTYNTYLRIYNYIYNLQKLQILYSTGVEHTLYLLSSYYIITI